MPVDLEHLFRPGKFLFKGVVAQIPTKQKALALMVHAQGYFQVPLCVFGLCVCIRLGGMSFVCEHMHARGCSFWMNMWGL